jgi:hypothetical protein
MTNKSFAYEQNGLRQSVYAVRATRSYPSSLTTYMGYIRHSRSLIRLGYFTRHELNAITLKNEVAEPLNPYSRLFMIIWALAMMVAVGLRSDKVANLMANKRVERTALSSSQATSVDRLAYQYPDQVK